MIESKTEKESLIEALNFSYKNELPEEYKDTKRVWARAIVKVLKCDNSRNYAVAYNNGNNGADIIKDFGNMASIVKVENVYPIDYLDTSTMPDLRKQSDIVSYLSRHGLDEEKVKALISSTDENGEKKSDEVKEADRQKVKALVISNAMSDYIEFHKEKQRLYEFKNSVIEGNYE